MSSGAIGLVKYEQHLRPLSFCSRRTGLGCRKSEPLFSFVCKCINQMLYCLEHRLDLLPLFALAPLEVLRRRAISSCVASIELAEKIKKGQFKIGKLGGTGATIPEIWQAALAA